MITIPDSHLKGDHKELESMKKKAKGILATVNDMQKEDKQAKVHYGRVTYKCKSKLCRARVVEKKY